jgi:hypothetical protein
MSKEIVRLFVKLPVDLTPEEVAEVSDQMNVVIDRFMEARAVLEEHNDERR